MEDKFITVKVPLSDDVNRSYCVNVAKVDAFSHRHNENLGPLICVNGSWLSVDDASLESVLTELACK